MTRIVYVNGEFLPAEQARVSIFDRGFLFADGVYEVSSVLQGRLIDNAAHLERLARSLGELAIRSPASPAKITAIQRELIEKNALLEGLVYVQVTRGPAERDFAYPDRPDPALVLFTQSRALIENPMAKRGLRIMTLPDIRWRRRDIKTVGLLAQSMAKQAALERGLDDAWLVESELVTEGTSSNAWIVTDTGVLRTRDLGHDILAGITRAAVLRLASENGLRVVEEPFSPDEAMNAAEAFSTSASSFVYPIVEIDGRRIGSGTPGLIASRLRRLYIEMALQQAAVPQP